VGRASARRPSRRPARLPDRGEHPDLPAGVLPRLLRVVLHRGAAACTGCREAWHRPDLVWRAAGGEHADLVHASAFWFCAVLPALGGAANGQDDADLLGCGALRDHPDHHGCDHHRLSATGDDGAGQAGSDRYRQGRDRGSG